MAMILDAFMSKCSTLLTDFVQEEVIMLLGVKGELQKLQQRMATIQSLLKDAEKKKFDDSSIDHWLSELKDVMYDADDIIDLCRIEGAQLLANQNPKSKTSPVWVCVSQTYSETELLKQIIRGAKGSYENAKTKAELQPFLRDSVVSGKNLFLVLDDVWRADVWVNLLRAPLYNANTSVRVLVTTRYEDVAKDMEAKHIHPVMNLSMESSWEMLRKRLFSEEQEELANGLKELGFLIVERCGGLPLAIKAISGVLSRKERSKKEWEKILRNDAWSISKLPKELRGALYLSFEDLPSHLKQCFLYFSLFPEDAELSRRDFTRLWVAEGFVAEQQDSLMEDSGEEYFNELLRRNLLLPDSSNFLGNTCKMHDLTRSLTLFLSKEESSFGDFNLRNSIKSTKLRRLSVAHEEKAVDILDSVAEPKALRTLLASKSDLILDDERLRRLSHLRVLHIKKTKIQILPDSIGILVHLRYLDLDGTDIRAIPESIKHLTNLQFFNIRACKYLTQLPSGITQLHNLRRLGLFKTPLSFIPKGIGKLQKLNDLSGFVVANNESSSKLEELNSLKQIRMLSICNLERAQSGAIILRHLPCLSDLKLYFSENSSEPNEEDKLAVEKLFDELVPPRSLEELKLIGFYGCRFPNWMSFSSFETFVPFLTRLEFGDIPSITVLPPLGQLPELKLLTIRNASELKKIGPEFLGVGVNLSTMIAFPKLELLNIHDMPMLEEWSFGAQVEDNASPMVKLLPCLRELSISDCPLLKQLPKDLNHSAMKSLCIEKANSLKSVDDLPTETEELQLVDNQNLEKIYCLPTLKRLLVINCEALSCVENLDSLQELILFDYNKESLPQWLLILLQQRGLQNHSNEDFLLHLQCSEKALRQCIEGGSHWELIQHIPRVIAYEDDPFGIGTGYLRYSKQPYVYDTNL
ncbi:hypothetical protein M5K25_001418 [Dendrobium thyrsiflorum]|uniref:Uncharacterized protein n=1 Tax=Dendrobium thyrsiflorum TaxID=117978 RepID=A0ABD0VQF8_DENTH